MEAEVYVLGNQSGLLTCVDASARVLLAHSVWDRGIPLCGHSYVTQSPSYGEVMVRDYK
jgi:hypothetical protein